MSAHAASERAKLPTQSQVGARASPKGILESRLYAARKERLGNDDDECTVEKCKATKQKGYAGIDRCARLRDALLVPVGRLHADKTNYTFTRFSP
jgi:hypothetical protein